MSAVVLLSHGLFDSLVSFVVLRMVAIIIRLRRTQHNLALAVAVGNWQCLQHKKREFVRGRAHTNTVDWFWSHVKGSLRGTHKTVSPKYLQSHLDGFVFHRNNGGSDRERFFALLDTVLRSPRES